MGLAVILASVGVLHLPAAGAAPTITVPASIDATGATDVTNALNAVVSSAPDGAVIRFPAGATYRVEGTFHIRNRTGLTIEGNGSTIIANTDGTGAPAPSEIAHKWPRHRNHVLVSGSTGITVRNLYVRGPHVGGGRSEAAWRVEYEAQHAFEAMRSSDIRFEGCRASQIYGDGVYIGNRSSDVTVTGCRIERNGRQGMSITSGTGITIVGNHLDEIRRTMFDLEPNTASDHISDVLIADNVLGASRLNFVSAHGSGGTFDNVVVRDNTLERMSIIISIQPPAGRRRSNITIAGNHSSFAFGSPAPSIRLARVDGALVEGNTQPMQPGRSMVGVHSWESCGVLVRDNSFPNAATIHRSDPYACGPVTPPTTAPPTPTTAPPPPPPPAPTTTAPSPTTTAPAPTTTAPAPTTTAPTPTTAAPAPPPPPPPPPPPTSSGPSAPSGGSGATTTTTAPRSTTTTTPRSTTSTTTPAPGAGSKPRSRNGTNADFVDAAFDDFLGRPATAEEQRAWTQSLEGGASRAALVQALASSDEWIGNVVSGFYQSTLRRSPDAAGRRYWIDRIRGGETPAQVGAMFYASPEYFASAGGTYDAWVRDLYDEILRRPAEGSGAGYWASVARSQGLTAVAGPFFQSIESRAMRVQNLYQLFLGRPADRAGLEHWATILADGRDLQLAVYLATSEEYVVRALSN